MKDSMTDKVKGAFHETKGKVREMAGIASGDKEMEGNGSGERISGKVQKKVGQIKTVLGK
jgi:uncharacterized protein YjbJ (UPF0337 family)